jgi:ElaB/YqjD/DUF883 family membrane-anchored ribosome-binding protein
MKMNIGMNQNLKNEIQKHLSQGKEKLDWLENQITDEKNHKHLQMKLEEAQKKIAELKKNYTEFEKKAVHYTEKNPKKALAIATVAGILAASLWNAFQRKETSSSPQPARKAKSAPVKTKSRNKKTAVKAKKTGRRE